MSQLTEIEAAAQSAPPRTLPSRADESSPLAAPPWNSPAFPDSPWSVSPLTVRQWQWRIRLRTPWSFRTRWPLALPLAALIALTLLFRCTPLDLTISGWFYDPVSGQWPWFFSAPCTLFYRLGIYPPIALACLGGVLFLFGRSIDGTESLTRAGLFVVLLMALGPGVIVNLGLKTHWGRARPHEIHEFGGAHVHTLVGSFGSIPRANSSFPSGHAALAFSLMAPGFLVSRRRPRLSAALFAVGLMYGVGMSAARIAQGGHFASDVLWSCAIVYFVGAALARLVLREPDVLSGNVD